MSERRPAAGPGGPFTLHMLPVDRWVAWRDEPAHARYEPEAFAADGFVHCTDGAEQMVATANRHYRADPRAFVVLELDLAAVGAPWCYEDAGRRYPHVHGPLARASGRSAAAILRGLDGVFTSIGEASPA